VEQGPLISVGLPIALFIIMVGIGLTLTAEDFRREARAPKGAVVATTAQLLLMPLLGFAIVALLDLPPVLAVGLVIAAACPGGSTSNLIAFLARANVALSIVLTVLASIGTILTMPFFVRLALDWKPAADDVDVSMPIGRTVGLLVGIILVPVALGMLLRLRAPARAAAIERAVSTFGAVVLVLLVIGIAYSVRDRFWELLSDAGPAALLLNVGGIAIGYGVASIARLPRADRLTASVELGVKNTTIGMLLAITVIGSEEMAVPSAVYGLVMYVSAGALVFYGRRALPSVADRRAGSEAAR
jgi:bile acid:Na+ symporter, BASS family